MFTIKKTVTVAGSHSLDLPYESKCKNLHGHNWKITVTVSSQDLDSQGMVVDFSIIKELVNRLDHANLNDIVEPSTAECIAEWLAQTIQSELNLIGRGNNEPQVEAVEVEESEGSWACYTP